MEKRHLTNPLVKRIPEPIDRAIFIHDSKLTGFCVSVSPKGKRTFYFYGRLKGQPKRIRIGTFPELTTNQAREICKGIIGDAAKGKDVHHDRVSGRRTLGELFDLYLTTHAKPKKRTWERDVKEFESFYSHWKRKPISDIRRGMVADLVADLTASRGPGAAHKARALLSKMFNIAVKHEWSEFNPVVGTDRPTFQARERYLRPDEVGKFFAAVEQLQRDTSKDFIKLAVFTGARRSNLCTLEWNELDLIQGIWTIPREKYKGKRTHTIPLIPQALEILQRRASERAPGCPWVFPGGGKTGHIVEPKAAMQRVKELAGIKDLRFHDLRRSLGAWQNNSGASIRVIQQTLGHADIATTARHYSPNEAEVIRQSMKAAVDAAMGGGE